MTAKLSPTMDQALLAALRPARLDDLAGKITEEYATKATLRALAARGLVTLEAVEYERAYATQGGRARARTGRRFGVELVGTLTADGWDAVHASAPEWFAYLAHRLGTVAAAPLTGRANAHHGRGEVAAMLALGWITLDTSTADERKELARLTPSGWRAWMTNGKTIR